jgi:hypothetical protein
MLSNIHLTYSTPAYKSLIEAGGDYYSILDSFLRGADVFVKIRAEIRRNAGDQPLSEDDEFQLLDRRLRTMTAAEHDEMVNSIRARKLQYDSQFTLDQSVAIASGRHMNSAAKSAASMLHSTGFTAVPHLSSIPRRALSSMDTQQAQQYYSEIINLVKSQLLPVMQARSSAAFEVRGFCNSHLIRMERAAGSEGSGGADEPLTFVHNDFTSLYKTVVLSSYAGGGDGSNEVDGFHPARDCRKEMQEAGLTLTQLRESRILVLNTWRSIGAGHGLRRKPLAVCDMRTLDPVQDLFSESVGPGSGALQTCSALYSPKHKW